VPFLFVLFQHHPPVIRSHRSPVGASPSRSRPWRSCTRRGSACARPACSRTANAPAAAWSDYYIPPPLPASRSLQRARQPHRVPGPARRPATSCSAWVRVGTSTTRSVRQLDASALPDWAQPPWSSRTLRSSRRAACKLRSRCSIRRVTSEL
jgi:hypothetical protein